RELREEPLGGLDDARARHLAAHCENRPRRLEDAPAVRDQVGAPEPPDGCLETEALPRVRMVAVELVQQGVQAQLERRLRARPDLTQDEPPLALDLRLAERRLERNLRDQPEQVPPVAGER